MTRVLRYPRFTMLSLAAVFACALGRDVCVSASLTGPANVLLVLTIALLFLCLVLLSCRFFVDACGVGVGFLLRVRKIDWEDIASLGLLSCNSRRKYLYGMYRGRTDFISLLHEAPRCGPWGFVVPVSQKLLSAVCHHCPFSINLSPMPAGKAKGRLRRQWHQAVIHLLVMLPAALLASVTAALMLLQAVQRRAFAPQAGLTLCALTLCFAALTLVYRAVNTASTCPGYSAEGVCAGRRLHLFWQDVRFCYVHRFARMSGMFLLSEPLEALNTRNAPPVFCLSMPDTSTLLLSYLTYCPHAEKPDRSE